MASPDLQFHLFAQSIDPLRSFNERMQASTTLLDDYLERLATPPRRATAGTCRHCGCQGDSCTLPSGDKCEWSNAERTCCTGASCMNREAKAAKPVPAKPITRREAQQPCDCVTCSGRARGRCRRLYYGPRP